MLGEYLDDSPEDNPGNRLETERELIGDMRKWSVRTRTNFEVTITPGNSSDRWHPAIRGRGTDISPFGCGASSKAAPRVGDIYLLQFDKDNPHLTGQVYARCVRCQQLSEYAFESGFAFVAEQNLQPVDQIQEDLLT